MNIKKATIADIQRIHQIAQAAFDRDQVPEALIQKQLIGGRVTYLLAEDESGFLSYHPLLDEVDLSYLAVDPQFQGKGVGQALLQAFLRANQGRRALLEVAENNVAARHLYEKNGFVSYTSRPNYYHDGQTAILMEKKL